MTTALEQLLRDEVFQTPNGYGNDIALRHLAEAIDAVAAGSFPVISATGVTGDASLGTLPANGFILFVLFRETAGVDVDVSIGTTSGASDVLDPKSVPANGTMTVPITSFSFGWFSATATQALFLSSASWGGASVNASLLYRVGS